MLATMMRLPVLMLVVILVALGAIAKSPSPTPSASSKATTCAASGNATARISRADLAWLIEIPVGSDRASMMQRLGTPYCFLHNGNDLIKVAYPGAWETSTWIIVIYQGDRYAGFDLSYSSPEPH